MFAAGIIANHAGILDKISYKDAKRWLLISMGIGIPSWALIIFYGGAMNDNMQMFGGLNWPAFFFALWESFFCLTFILALIGLFRHKVNVSGKLQKFMSDQAFGVFVFHAPVLVGISMGLKLWVTHPVLKFFVVFPLALILSFLVSWLVRKIKPLKQVFS
jgi:surface polysaccharide O-acyltransferase-like enzyme